MADHPRDKEEFIEQEVDPSKRPEEALLKSIKVVSSLNLTLTAAILTLRIHNSTIPLLYAALVLVFGSILLWALCIFWLSKQKYPRIAMVILSLTVHATLSLWPLFALLLALKLDGLIDPHPVVLVIPLFIWQVFMLSFLVFIIPGLQDTETGSTKWAWVHITYYLASLLTQIAVVILLSTTTQYTWFLATGFLLSALTFNLMVLLTTCKLSTLWPCIVLLSLINAVVMLTVILDQPQPATKVQLYALMVPLLAVSLVHTIKSLL